VIKNLIIGSFLLAGCAGLRAPAPLPPPAAAEPAPALPALPPPPPPTREEVREEKLDRVVAETRAMVTETRKAVAAIRAGTPVPEPVPSFTMSEGPRPLCPACPACPSCPACPAPIVAVAPVPPSEPWWKDALKVLGGALGMGIVGRIAMSIRGEDDSHS
jgi:hypothetical protein